MEPFMNFIRYINGSDNKKGGLASNEIDVSDICKIFNIDCL
jgi:hypothetical protein